MKKIKTIRSSRSLQDEGKVFRQLVKIRLLWLSRFNIIAPSVNPDSYSAFKKRRCHNAALQKSVIRKSDQKKVHYTIWRKPWVKMRLSKGKLPLCVWHERAGLQWEDYEDRVHESMWDWIEEISEIQLIQNHWADKHGIIFNPLCVSKKIGSTKTQCNTVVVIVVIIKTQRVRGSNLWDVQVLLCIIHDYLSLQRFSELSWRSEFTL